MLNKSLAPLMLKEKMEQIINKYPTWHKKYNLARIESEHKAVCDLEDRWCVCLMHGAFMAFPYKYAIEHSYHIVSVTLY